MAIWHEIEEQALNTVDGLRWPDGAPNPEMLRICQKVHGRSYFYCAELNPLSGLSSQLSDVAASLDLSHFKRPSRVLIAKAQEGQEAVSLETILAIREVIAQALKEKDRLLPNFSKLIGVLEKRFPHPNVLPSSSITPAFYSITPGRVKELHSLLGENLDRLTFSEHCLHNAFSSRLAERNFFQQLEDGYDSPAHHEKGRYRLTALTVSTVYSRLKAMAAGRELPPIYELFQTDPKDGPRKGQVSKGLRVSSGNLIPNGLISLNSGSTIPR